MPRSPESPRRSPAPRPRAILREHGDVLLAVAAGGAVGSLGRWGVGELVPHTVGDFAWATFAVNVSGALLAGLLMALVADLLPPTRYLRPVLGVGVLGGWTTFSAYMLDARLMLEAGRAPTAPLLYLAGTLLVGLVAVWAGLLAGRALVAVARVRTAEEAP